MEADTTAKSWYLVTFLDDNENPLGDLFWGIVVEDRKRRFQPGHYVCSSRVIDELDESRFRTRNSVYEGIGDGLRVTMHLRHIEKLKAGFSPDEIEGMQNLPLGFTPAV